VAYGGESSTADPGSSAKRKRGTPKGAPWVRYGSLPNYALRRRIRVARSPAPISRSVDGSGTGAAPNSPTAKSMLELTLIESIAA
jgi:hypothetical protein